MTFSENIRIVRNFSDEVRIVWNRVVRNLYVNGYTVMKMLEDLGAVKGNGRLVLKRDLFKCRSLI